MDAQGVDHRLSGQLAFARIVASREADLELIDESRRERPGIGERDQVTSAHVDPVAREFRRQAAIDHARLEPLVAVSDVGGILGREIVVHAGVELVLPHLLRKTAAIVGHGEFGRAEVGIGKKLILPLERRLTDKIRRNRVVRKGLVARKGIANHRAREQLREVALPHPDGRHAWSQDWRVRVAGTLRRHQRRMSCSS